MNPISISLITNPISIILIYSVVSLTWEKHKTEAVGFQDKESASACVADNVHNSDMQSYWIEQAERDAQFKAHCAEAMTWRWAL